MVPVYDSGTTPDGDIWMPNGVATTPHWLSFHNSLFIKETNPLASPKQSHNEDEPVPEDGPAEAEAALCV